MPGTPTPSQVSVDRPFTTLPCPSWNMVGVAAAGAFSRMSTKAERPSAKRMFMKPPPPRLPAAGNTTASA